MADQSGWTTLNPDQGGGIEYVAAPGAPDDTVRLSVAGDAFPRVEFDPNAGEVRVGDGTAPTVPIGAAGVPIPAAFATLTDVAFPFAPARADQFMLNGAGELEQVPYAVWSDPVAMFNWKGGGSAGLPLVITTTALPNGVGPPSGQAYSATVAATGGVTPYVWSATGLPTGLSIAAATGVISGTPSATGPFSPMFTVSDGAGTVYSVAIGILIVASTAPFSFALPALAHGAPNVAYSPVDFSADCSGGTPPYTFVASSLPPGMAVSTAGILSGTPTTQGNFNISVTATPTAGSPASITDTAHLIVDPYLSITNTNNPPSGRESTAYTQYLFTASGGSGSYQWGILSGALPAGMTFVNFLNAGVLGGTPNAGTAAGSPYNFTLIVTDTSSPQEVDAQAYSLTITASGAALAFALPATLAGGTAGTPYSKDVSSYASAGTPPYHFTIQSGGGLGLTISDAGVISGTPSYTQSGNITPTVRVTDSAGSPAHVDKATSITIATGPPTFDIGQWVSTNYSLAAGTGTFHRSGAAITAASAAAATAGVNARAASAKSAGGVVVNLEAAGVIPVGMGTGSRSWDAPLIDTNCKLWDLNGVTPGTFSAEITLARFQPPPTPSLTAAVGAIMFRLHDVAGANVRVPLNGNAKYQHTEFDGSTTVQNWNGCFYHGFRYQNCSLLNGYVKVRNTRCVSTLSGTNVAPQPAPGIPAGAVHRFENPNYNAADIAAGIYWTDAGGVKHGYGHADYVWETMAVQNLSGTGGDNFDVQVYSDDGAAVAGYQSPDQASEARGYAPEGCQFNTVTHSAGPITIRVHQGHHCRQIVGSYGTTADLDIAFDPAGTFGHCDEGVNLESAGTAAGAWTIHSTIPGTRYTFTNNLVDARINGQSTGGGAVTITDCNSDNAGPAGNITGAHVLMTGTPWARVTLNNSHVISPANGGIWFLNNVASWRAITYINGCAISVADVAKAVVQGGSHINYSLLAGHGTWGTF